MTPGYYRAKHKQRGWIVVRAVDRLYDAVLEDGYAVKISEFREWSGPLALSPSESDAEIDRLRAQLSCLVSLVSIHCPELVAPEVKREASPIPQP